MNEFKVCSTCKIEKSLSFFGKDKARKDGYKYVCKECFKLVSKKYVLLNKKKRKETCKKYRENHADACKESYLKWQEKEKANGWATKMAYDQANPEQRKLRSKRWAEKNPDYLKLQKHKRRGASGSFTKKDIDFLMTSQKSKCVVCFTSLLNEKHIDHILPIALGGTNNPTNLQLLCPKCNRQKSAKHPVDFMQEKGFLL